MKPVMFLLRTAPIATILAFTAAACGDDATPGGLTGAGGPQRQYGAAVQVGQGRARAYALLDEKGGAPIEVGVALD